MIRKAISRARGDLQPLTFHPAYKMDHRRRPEIPINKGNGMTQKRHGL